MTALDRLEEKARQEGIQKGLVKGKLESARNFLQNGVALDIILKSTGLTREQLIEAGIIER